MGENKTIMDYETVALSMEKDAVVIIDQTLLPGTTKLIELREAKEIWEAIYLRSKSFMGVEPYGEDSFGSKRGR